MANVQELKARLNMVHLTAQQPGVPRPRHPAPIELPAPEPVELPGDSASTSPPRRSRTPPPLPKTRPRPPTRSTDPVVTDSSQPEDEEPRKQPPLPPRKASGRPVPPPPPALPPRRPSSPALSTHSSSSDFSTTTAKTWPEAPATSTITVKPKPTTTIKYGYKSSFKKIPPATEGPRGLPPVNAAVPQIPSTPWGKHSEDAGKPLKPGFSKRPSFPANPGPPKLPDRTPSDSVGESRTLPPPTLRASKSAGTLRPIPPVPKVAPPPLPQRSSHDTGVPKVKDPVLPAPSRDPRKWGLNKSEDPPNVPKRPDLTQASQSQPPPVPMGTRPTINLANKPTSQPQAASAYSSPPAQSFQPTINAACLLCRDFSHVDAHAARFPRHAYDNVSRLAMDLTSPFGSHTDKARAIFTWLHHNIIYDVDAFFGNRVKPSTPESTLRTGLAVCEGYAGLFAAMAKVAGLQAVVVGGHGKGYGYEESSTIPKYESNHAWNACRIDNGEWKLIDPCWGAGHLDTTTNRYAQKFDPSHFTMSNDQFGQRHFPNETEYQFRSRPWSWEEYILYRKTDGPECFGIMRDDDKRIGESTVEPRVSTLRAYTRYRFRIGGMCEHEPLNTPWLIIAKAGKTDVFMRPDGQGGLAAELTTGEAGSKVDLTLLHEFCGKSAKGMTIKERESATGALSWSYLPICSWPVV
ncbi:hypothetical protein ABW19_dt0208278 [Dactylella cylindrospora]|nr:hypothetical protein ABW19_dt0208278 [Dactylella cylindrospora]